MDNPSDPLPAAAPIHGPEPQVTIGEVKIAIKNMKPRKAAGLATITANVIKMMDKNAEWLWHSPLSFVMAFVALSEEIRRDLPWEMLFVDDLVISTDDEKSLQENIWKWQRCMERRGLCVNTVKAEVMVSSKERENINVVVRHNNQLKQTELLQKDRHQSCVLGHVIHV